MATDLNGTNPFIRYFNNNFWSKPERDMQFQVHMPRISVPLGVVNNFKYMGEWRTLPTGSKFYHVFTVGGIDPGYWGFTQYFKTTNPLDKWVSLSEISNVRGLQIDVYNGRGIKFPLNKAWVLMSYDGITLIALEKSKLIPVTVTDEWYFRVYNPSVEVDKLANNDLNLNNPYYHGCMDYENTIELNQFMLLWNNLRSKSTGMTYCFHNGLLSLKTPKQLDLTVGDVVEIWHDPTLETAQVFELADLPDFYSELDSKRKVIVHPPKDGSMGLKYFDDTDIYVLDKYDYGVYLHNNSVTGVRNITHRDYSISYDQILQHAQELPGYQNDASNLRILVLTRRVNNNTASLIYNSSGINYLYELTDEQILKAFTGEDSGVDEWQANSLEQSDLMKAVRCQPRNLTRTIIYDGIGYSGATVVSAKNVLRAEYQAGGLGVELPPTYGMRNEDEFPLDNSYCMVNEYDANGLLINPLVFNSSYRYSPKHSDTKLIELFHGDSSDDNEIQGVIVPDEGIVLANDAHLTVYSARMNLVNQTFMEDLVDVTGQAGAKYLLYDNDDGTVTLKEGPYLDYGDKLYAVTSDRFLSKQFTSNHLDKSLSFKLVDDTANSNAINANLVSANFDIWMNGYSLIDNVDWTYDSETRRFYIFNKEYLKSSGQEIVVIGKNVHGDQLEPKYETELGFVENGKIGTTERYNLREDRNVRCVIGGRFFPIEEVPSHENGLTTSLPAELEGKPYMVKHVYQDVQYGPDKHDHFRGYVKARDLDQRISDYMSNKVTKVGLGTGTQTDRYALFSTFMNKIVNDIILGVITIPEIKEGMVTFDTQDVYDKISGYLPLLAFDPVKLDFDPNFFDIFPYANLDKVTVTSKELLFLDMVNKLHLDSRCKITSNFEVNDNVR